MKPYLLRGIFFSIHSMSLTYLQYNLMPLYEFIFKENITLHLELLQLIQWCKLLDTSVFWGSGVCNIATPTWKVQQPITKHCVHFVTTWFITPLITGCQRIERIVVMFNTNFLVVKINQGTKKSVVQYSFCNCGNIDII